jgi:hypothetical protein
MKLRLAIATVAALAMVASPARAIAPADISLTFDSVSTVTSVSPDVFYDESSKTFYLFTTGMGIGVYTSPDGASWTAVPGASTPREFASDPSVVDMGDGTYRMYYAYRTGTGPGSPCSGKELRYATSSDLVRWTVQPGTLLGDLGCGVPNVVRAGVADFRLYYVRGGVGTAHGTYVALSTDGLTWTPGTRLITPTDIVDPSVVRLNDGSWLMLAADFPSGKTPGPFLQKLYTGTSTDGLVWTFDASTPLHAGPPGEGAFDPDAVVMPDGSIRAWWSQGTSADTARVAAGTVIVSTPPEPVAPAKPTTKWSKTSLKVAWSYPDGAAAPDVFRIEVRTKGAWRQVAQVGGSRTSTSVRRGDLPKTGFTVRVVAVIGDKTAASAPTVVRR